MNAKLIKSLSVFTDAELFEISRKYFGYNPNDICKVIDRIESAMYFGEFCLDNVIKEYGKTNLADERPERVYSGLTEKELRNFFAQNISKYNCIEQMLTDTYGKKGFCVAFGIEWKSYDEAMEVLTKYTSERPERVNEPNNNLKRTSYVLTN